MREKILDLRIFKYDQNKEKKLYGSHESDQTSLRQFCVN